MKKATAVVLVLWGSISAGAGCSSRKPPVNRTFHFDLGKVFPGKSTKTTARLVNQEGFALRLVRAEVTCGCLKPEIEPTEIEPGGEAVAALTLVHPNKEGAFEQRASFIFAGGNDREIVYTLFIGGITLSWIAATPAVVDFGRHMMGERCVAQTQLQFPEPVATSDLEIECSNPLLSAKLAAGASDTEKTLEMTYNTTKSTNAPESEGYIRIYRKNTNFFYNLPYKAAFDSLYKVEPDRLSLGIVAVQKSITASLHFSSSTIDWAKGHWQVDSAPEGLTVKILAQTCAKKRDIAEQTVTIQLLATKPGIYRGTIALRHEQTRLRLELPCSLMARNAKR